VPVLGSQSPAFFTVNVRAPSRIAKDQARYDLQQGTVSTDAGNFGYFLPNGVYTDRSAGGAPARA
jgi:hypothetical protein